MELEEVLADPVKRDAFRRQLLGYPRETEESVERKLRTYEERVAAKRYFRGPGLDWNALAEAELDEYGYLRPPGWKAVFFYPDSRRPRNHYVALAALAVGLLWFFGSLP
jgi:hypothetical protein